MHSDEGQRAPEKSLVCRLEKHLRREQNILAEWTRSPTLRAAMAESVNRGHASEGLALLVALQKTNQLDLIVTTGAQLAALEQLRGAVRELIAVIDGGAPWDDIDEEALFAKLKTLRALMPGAADDPPAVPAVVGGAS